MRTSEVVCAIIIHDGMLLATKRNKRVTHNDMWEFPGGRPLPSETSEHCIIRRIKEELNVNVRIIDSLPTYTINFDTREKEFIMHPFIVEIVDGEIELKDHSQAVWFKPTQLLRIAWPETDTPLIEEIAYRMITKGSII